MARPAIKFTPEKINKIKILSSEGMSLRLIAESIDCGVRTIRRHEKAFAAYLKERIEVKRRLNQCLYARILSGKAEPSLLIFAAKTQLGWRDESMHKRPEFHGTIAEKFKSLDEDFKDGIVSVEEFESLNRALVSRWQAEEQEDRIAKLEVIAKIKTKQGG